MSKSTQIALIAILGVGTYLVMSAISTFCGRVMNAVLSRALTIFWAARPATPWPSVI
jgi:hypothetical protein